jgi:hypothetical protein
MLQLIKAQNFNATLYSHLDWELKKKSNSLSVDSCQQPNLSLGEYVFNNAIDLKPFKLVIEIKAQTGQTMIYQVDITHTLEVAELLYQIVYSYNLSGDQTKELSEEAAQEAQSLLTQALGVTKMFNPDFYERIISSMKKNTLKKVEEK